MVGLNIFVISLKKSSRRRFQEKQFSKLGLDFNFLDATSKDVVSNSDEVYSDWERPLSLSEIACYKSHRNAWEKTANSTSPSLILEDDAVISMDLPKLIQSLLLKTNADYVNLENRNRKKIVSKNKVLSEKEFSLLKLYHDSTGAAGYILYPNGAKKILACEKKFGVALADAQISRCNSLIKLQVEPALIIQLDMSETYGIKINEDNLHLSKSTVSSSERPLRSYKFHFRRIMSQLKLGFRKIYLCFYAERRYIRLASKNSFISF
jgi:glycosyl transferase family 25